MAKIIEYQFGTDQNIYSKQLEKLTTTVLKNKNYLEQYNNRVERNISKAIINSLKLDESKWKELGQSFYKDFHQVRYDDKTIKFTYSLSISSGLAIRRKYAQWTSVLQLHQYEEFINNKEAVKKLNDITGQPQLIDVIKKIITKDRCNSNIIDKNITLHLNDIEKKMFVKFNSTISKYEISAKKDMIIVSYNIYDKLLNIEPYMNNRINSNDVSEIDTITKRIILNNHMAYILKEGNKHTRKQSIKCKKFEIQAEDNKELLSKWLLLEMI